MTSIFSATIYFQGQKKTTNFAKSHRSNKKESKQNSFIHNNCNTEEQNFWQEIKNQRLLRPKNLCAIKSMPLETLAVVDAILPTFFLFSDKFLDQNSTAQSSKNTATIHGDAEKGKNFQKLFMIWLLWSRESNYSNQIFSKMPKISQTRKCLKCLNYRRLGFKELLN